MQQFFSSFLRKNKILFFVFLITITGIVLPKTTLGFVVVSNDSIIQGQQAVGGITPTTAVAPAATSICDTPAGAGVDTSVPGWNHPSDCKQIIALLTQPAEVGLAVTEYSPIFNYRMFEIGLGNLFVDGLHKISALSAIVLSYVIANVVSKPITTDEGWGQVWTQVRNLADMLIVLGFVVVGIATSLRIREYEAKRLLLPLIAIAILVNFSGLFCGLVIDASNMITGGLIGNGGAGMMPHHVLFKVTNASNDFLDQGMADGRPESYLGGCVMMGLVFLGLAFTFLYMAVIFIARYVILIILFILSPLAFAFWVYPVTKKLWTEWWDNFLKWAFIGVFSSVMLWLTSIVLKGQTALSSAKGVSNDIMGVAISCTIVLVFLYIGFKMTCQKTGIASMASGAIMGLAKGATGFAVGAIAGGGKLAGKSLDKLSGGGFSADKQKLGSLAGRASEFMGWKAQGSTASKMQGHMSEASKNVAGMSEDAKTRMAKRSGWGTTAQNRVAAIQDKIKNGNLKDLGNTEEQNRAIAFAESFSSGRGVSTNIRSDAEKQNYLLAGFNEKKIDGLVKQGSTPAEASDKLVQTQLDESLPGMSHSQLRGIESAHLTRDRVGRLGPEKLSAYRTGSRAQVDQIQGPAVRGAMDAERVNLEMDKRAGNRIDEGKLSKLTNQIKEIDALA